ncbi:MAG: tetratricopeptide repeat protein [Nitrospirae bacterium]|nr:tetratricopeptide repeat protein [Nitrospirota bacterium]
MKSLESIDVERKAVEGTDARRLLFGAVLITVCLILMTFVVFLPVRYFGFVNYDDDDYIVNNSRLLAGLTAQNVSWAFTAKQTGNWHPLTWMSYMLDIDMYGVNPGAMHMTNVYLHVVNTILVFILFAIMTDAMWRSGFIAALFALHPMHVESVAWISQRKDVLSALFWILTMIAYVYYTRGPSYKRYFLTLLCFVLGLLSKPILVTLPLVLLLMDYWPLGRFNRLLCYKGTWAEGRDNTLHGVRSVFVEKIPFFILSALSSVITFYVQNEWGNVATTDLVSFKIRFGNAAIAYALYVMKMLVPMNMSCIYPLTDQLSVWQVVFAVFFISLACAFAVRERMRHPAIFVGCLWFLITLIPVIGIVQVGLQSMADRYTYIPYIGLFIVVVMGVPDKFLVRKALSVSLLALALVVLLLCAFIARRQVGVWYDNFTLFRHAAQVTSNNYIAHYNLATALTLIGSDNEAVYHYRKAVEFKRDYVNAYINLGIIALKYNNNAEALNSFKKALEFDPNLPLAYNGLGLVLKNEGKVQEAISYFQKAIELAPDFTGAYDNLKSLTQSR